MGNIVISGLGGSNLVIRGLGPEVSDPVYQSCNLVNQNLLSLSTSSGACSHVGSGNLLNQNLGFVAIAKTAVMYFSVGDSYPANLYTGTPYVKIQNNTAYFSEPLLGNVGAGDKLIYDGGKVCFLKNRISYSEWTVLDHFGEFVIETSDFVPVEGLARCFKTIDAAVGSSGGVPYASGIANAQYMGITNLATTNTRAIIFCYRDNNAIDTTATIIEGFETKAGNDISIITAGSITEPVVPSTGEMCFSNFPQHSAMPGEGYILSVDETPAITTKDVCVNILGIEISGTCNEGVYVKSKLNTNSMVSVKNCIINNTGNHGIRFAYEEDNEIPLPILTNASLWCNIFYGQIMANIYLEHGVENLNVYQNTIDRGNTTNRVMGIKIGNGYTGIGRVNTGYNVFVGGKSGYDIVDTGATGVVI